MFTKHVKKLQRKRPRCHHAVGSGKGQNTKSKEPGWYHAAGLQRGKSKETKVHTTLLDQWGVKRHFSARSRVNTTNRDHRVLECQEHWRSDWAIALNRDVYQWVYDPLDIICRCIMVILALGDCKLVLILWAKRTPRVLFKNGHRAALYVTFISKRTGLWHA